jgi:hypothetical protein
MNDFHLLYEPVPVTLFLSYVRLEPQVNKSYEISTVCEEYLDTAKRDNKRIWWHKSILMRVQLEECTGDDGTCVAYNMRAEVWNAYNILFQKTRRKVPHWRFVRIEEVIK